MSSLPIALDRSLLLHPQLLEEFPQMIAALDAGECVNLHKIRNDQMREELMEVLSYLPVELESGRGYFKSEKVKSVGGFLLMALLDSQAIKHPSNLNTIESSTAPLKILNMAAEDPGFLPKISRIFGKLIRGSSLELSDKRDDNQEIILGILTHWVSRREGGMFTLDKRTRSALKNLKRCLDRVRPEDKADKHKNLGRTEEFARVPSTITWPLVQMGTLGKRSVPKRVRWRVAAATTLTPARMKRALRALPASMEVNRVFGPQVASTDPPAERPF